MVRFWIASALCALVGLATLKVHVRDESPQKPVGLAAAGQPNPAAEVRIP